MLPADHDPLSDARHQQVRDELAATMGAVNVAHARLVQLAVTVLAEGHHEGPGLASPAHFLAWRTGQSLGTCRNVVRVARRWDDLPCLMAAFCAGELTLEQAAVVATYVPAEFDASATELAKCSTVAQLKAVLPAYRPKKEKSDDSASHHVATGADEKGWFISGRADDEQGAVVDQALAQSREDLFRARKADTPEGETVPPVTSAEALTAMAESYLRNGQAAHPGSERYQVNVHLEATPDGSLQLATHLGVVLDAGTRRRLLCDPTITAVVRNGLQPVDVGRATQIIGRKLRRLIQHRDRGCRVPGCGRTRGLEIHHIWHWEDGGPTDAANLLTLCTNHHHAHHRGELTITGTATNTTFRDRHGHPMEPLGQPTPPPVAPAPEALGPDSTEADLTPAAEARRAAQTIGLDPGRYRCPTGERLDRRDFHLSPTVGSRAPTGPPAP
jgi:hypothetical protein